MRKPVGFAVLLISSTLVAQPLTVGVMPPKADSSIFVFTVGPQTYVNLVNFATRDGTINRVSVGWSEPCVDALKIVFLRSNFQTTTNFTVVASRGPFASVRGRNDYTLSPPVTVNAGDLIGVVGLQAPSACGGPQVQQSRTRSDGYKLVTNKDLGTSGTVGTFTSYGGGTNLALIGFESAPLLTRVIPAAGAVQGASAFFRTSLQMINTSPSPLTGKLVFHPQGASASAADPSMTFSMARGQSLSYPDVIASMGASGLGSLDILTDSGTPPVAVVRVFSDGESAGTSGFSLDAIDPEEALGFFHTGVIPIPSDLTNFRMNIGVRTFDVGATLSVTTVDASGVFKKSREVAYAPNFFVQASATDFTGLTPLPSNGRIEIRLKNINDRALVYSSVIDNRTSDSTFRVAE